LIGSIPVAASIVRDSSDSIAKRMRDLARATLREIFSISTFVRGGFAIARATFDLCSMTTSSDKKQLDGLRGFPAA
jgi:hypothetical protein